MNQRKLRVLDLFSGIGGFSLGLHRAGMETVAFCEIEPYPQAVLRKNFPGVPIYDDVRTVTAERLRADGVTTVELICGGFPCQPFSVAGKQQGKDDHRHLWPEMLRIIQETKPTWVIGENVAGFVSMALCEVSADLESVGYEVQPFIIPACAINAPHRRDRVWIIAHAASEQNNGERGNSELGRDTMGREGQTTLSDNQEADYDSISGCRKVSPTAGNFTDPDRLWKLQQERLEQDIRGRVSNCDKKADGNTNGAGCEEQHTSTVTAQPGQHSGELVATGPNWNAESPFCGVADGIPKRVDRLKCLGNAVVPQIPEIIGRAIMAIEKGNLNAP